MKDTSDTIQIPSRVPHFLNVTFDGPQLSSTGGLALLSLIYAKLGLIGKAALKTPRTSLLKTAVLVRRTQRTVSWRLPMRNAREHIWRKLYACLA